MLMEILLTLVVGFVVGVVARFVIPGDQPMGWMATTLLGIGGAFLGGLGGQALGLYRIGEAVGWVGAVIGAAILLHDLPLGQAHCLRARGRQVHSSAAVSEGRRQRADGPLTRISLRATPTQNEPSSARPVRRPVSPRARSVREARRSCGEGGPKGGGRG